MASRDNFFIYGTTFGSRENTHFKNYSALHGKSPKIWVQLSNLSLIFGRIQIDACEKPSVFQ